MEKFRATHSTGTGSRWGLIIFTIAVAVTFILALGTHAEQGEHAR